MIENNQYSTLKVSRVLPFPLSVVYEAWTKPAIISAWFGPEGFTVTEVKADVSVGGKYSISMQAPDMKMIYHYGEYVEVAINQQLIFTWILSDQDCKGSKDINASTLVTIGFSKTKNGDTLIELVHEKLPNEDAYNGHQYGWVSSLESLYKYLDK